MAAFMITRLPSQSKSLEAIEFMQKNHFSYLLASDFTLFDVLVTSVKRDSRLATALGISEDFEQGKEEIHIIGQLVDIFESIQMIKRGDLIENNPPEERSAEEDRNVIQSVHVKSEEVDEQNGEEENTVNAVVNEVPINRDTEEGLPVVEAGLNETTEDDFLDFVGDDSGGELQFHGDEEDEEEHSVLNAAVDVSLEEDFRMRDDEEEEEEEYEDEEKEHDENDEEKMDDGQSKTADDEEEDESEDFEDETEDAEDYEEESEDEDEVGEAIQKKVLSRPSKSVHYRRLFACPIKDCPSSYKTFEELKDHMKIHSGKADLFCNVCKKDFSSLDVAMEHIRKRKEQKCCRCQKKFKHISQMLEHHRSHTGKRPFACGRCKKKFARSCNLNKHEKTHSGAKLFKCDQCSRKFTEKHNLRTHLRTHTGSKPFECGECKKRFTQSGHLKSHELTHTGDKPFKCDDCGRTFARKDKLTVHKRSHTGIKPFACKKCDEKFMWPSRLRNHMKNMHK